jgi:2-methylisocitrate lyase-like PEP mutase family enzyme
MVENRSRRLRQLLAEPGLLVIPEAVNALTARLVEQAGYPAVYTGGAGLSAMELGVPDHGLITSSELVEAAARIVESTSLPVICDADQGGETVLNVARTIRAFERAGVSGVHIEDSRNPKHLGRGDGLIPIERMAARIAAAVDARTEADFLIIARTDGLFYDGTFAEAVRRGVAYAEAGADVYFCLHLPAERADGLAAEVPIPILDINHPIETVERTALKVDVFCGQLAASIARLAEAMLADLREHGRYWDTATRRMTTERFAEVLGDADWVRLQRESPEFRTD